MQLNRTGSRSNGVALLAGLLFLCHHLTVLSETPNILTVDEAAQRIGEVVTFEGEVVSSPASPRRAVRYVNFGDAYPRQTLSLMFANEHTNILWKLPNLRGKSVRVTGKVESTRAGPVIAITNEAQLKVLGEKVIPASLDETGEGHPFRRRIFASVQKLFNDRNFATLEHVAYRWQNGRERYLDGHWKIQVYFDAFANMKMSTDSQRDHFFESLEEWKRAYPNSVIPYIIKANALTSYAWEARGTGYAHTVTEEGWRLFGERLALARAELEAVHDRRTTFPQWYLNMQVVALGQGWPRSEYEELFEEAVSTEPNYHFIYVNKARYLQTKWHGKPGEWEAFAKSLIARFPDGRGEEFYTFTVWNMRANVEQVIRKDGGRYFEDTDVEWAPCKAGFDRLRKKYPDSIWILNNYAFFAGKAHDRETVRALLMELGDRCDMSLWVTWENVAYARMWADGKLPPGVRMNLFD